MSEKRFTIEKQDHEYPCEHEMCETLHQRFIKHGVHLATRVEWIILDNSTGFRAFRGETYDTKREAQEALASELAWLDRAEVAS